MYSLCYIILLSSAVVVWCDMLGGVLTGENPLPWSGSLFSHQVSGERRATGKTSQCCLLPRNVSIKLQKDSMYSFVNKNLNNNYYV